MSSGEIARAEEGLRGSSGSPAEYFKSSEVEGGWDIYLHDTIPSDDRKRVLFHEILECNLRDQGFSNDDAHKITTEEEEKLFGGRVN